VPCGWPFRERVHGRVRGPGRQRYTTTVALHGLSLRRMVLGVTLPLGSRVGTVTLDGRRARHGSVQVTNRGMEVTVPVRRGARDGAPHTLVLTVR